MGNTAASVSLHVRIGIHTGLVVVGEMGTGEYREHMALGETPNLAARLQGLAAPDTVMISAATQRLIAGLFNCQDLGFQPEDTPQVKLGKLQHTLVRYRFPQADTLPLLAALLLAERMQEPALLLQAWHAQWATKLFAGDLPSARYYTEQGMAQYTPEQYSSHTFLYGAHDPGVCGLTVSAWVLWCLGYPDQALERSHAAMDLAQRLAHPESLVYALSFATAVHQFRGEVETFQEHVEAGITLSEEHGFALRAAMLDAAQGWVLVQRGYGKEGIAQMRQGLDVCRTTGTGVLQAWPLALLAEAYGKMGQVEEGLATLAEALEGIHRTGERWYEAELYRLKGTLTLQSKVPSLKSQVEEEAEACFHKAIEIARHQQAKSLELRAVMSLARLWQQQGKRDEARQMLAEIYGWFTEGFDTKDLQEPT
jgi:predicted ATPase